KGETRNVTDPGQWAPGGSFVQGLYTGAMQNIGLGWVHQEGVDEIANLGLFFYGLGRGFGNVAKEFWNIGLDVYHVAKSAITGKSEAFSSGLFKMTEEINFNHPSTIFFALGGMIAAPFIGVTNLIKAIAAGDPGKAGEELAGVL